MQSETTGPIVVNEHGDVEVFFNVQEALNALEITDVSRGEYEAYDLQGRKLDLSVEGSHVVFRRLDEDIDNSDRVSSLVRKYARAIGYPKLAVSNPDTVDLLVLVRAILHLRDELGR